MTRARRLRQRCGKRHKIYLNSRTISPIRLICPKNRRMTMIIPFKHIYTVHNNNNINNIGTYVGLHMYTHSHTHKHTHTYSHKGYIMVGYIHLFIIVHILHVCVCVVCVWSTVANGVQV